MAMCAATEPVGRGKLSFPPDVAGLITSRFARATRRDNCGPVGPHFLIIESIETPQRVGMDLEIDRMTPECPFK